MMKMSFLNSLAASLSMMTATSMDRHHSTITLVDLHLLTVAPKQGDEEEKGIYLGDESRPILNVFRLTTTKRYVKEDRTTPTSFPVEYAKNNLVEDLLSFISFATMITILVSLSVAMFLLGRILFC
ncbi:unnamed protein product [Larinioides sclopetarius]|uniref:Uncharacterized protein n=1 Tax=Larinioides sclopetarius TaxID=280406 RepID=A0AAV2BU22_9ARAC